LLVVQGNLTGIVYAEIPTDGIANAPLGVKHSIQAVNQGIDENLLARSPPRNCHVRDLRRVGNKKEGSSAFLAKRPPKFLGR
jgi:hypothetical protein